MPADRHSTALIEALRKKTMGSAQRYDDAAQSTTNTVFKSLCTVRSLERKIIASALAVLVASMSSEDGKNLHHDLPDTQINRESECSLADLIRHDEMLVDTYSEILLDPNLGIECQKALILAQESVRRGLNEARLHRISLGMSGNLN